MRSFQSQPEQGVGEPRVKRPAEERGRIVMREGKPRPLFFTGKRPKRDRHSRRKVSFFHFRNYEPAFKYFTEQVLDADFVPTPTPTRATIKRGEEMSADYVCTPFKHIIGDYAAALEQGADVLVQVTGFCRLNYYGELQEMILRDAGYTDFQMLNFSYVASGKMRDYIAYCKKVVNPNLSVAHGVKNLLGAYRMVEHIDAFRDRYLANAGFEVEPGSFQRVRKEFISSMNAAKTNSDIEDGFRRSMDALDALATKKPADPVRVGIVGEYYTAQDPTSCLNLEQKLLDMGVELSNAMSISAFNLHFNIDAAQASISEYSTYDMGPTSTFNIAAAKRYAEAGYDGIVHIKSAGCTPEIDVMPVLQRLSRDYHVPVLFLTFDTQTSDAGLDTRLEAFYDMIAMKKVR
ncbi:hypothetical protein [Enorma phocaeensis]|uniref:2-hydroxyacyl-CoA dehydratase n=1 Tax=Enorma phocaeensis TaxID=1871019 RepID=A0ABT7V7A4_9ACTN|nr:hypothetical protein [Enorma phocaeensis]MBM6953389.1 hypothetical protein [Enorma phocaeensis]MDM8274375.1 hypothetical protein [Enorma phocaeensis]